MRTVLIACLVAMLSPAPKVQAQQAAPFCLVSDTGNRSCFYYSLQACRQAAVSLGGMCAENSQAANSQQPNPWTSGQQVSPLEAMNQVQAAGDAGRRRGEEQREARLRAELLEAQIARERAESVRAAERPAAGGKALYRCVGADGVPNYSARKLQGNCQLVTAFPEQTSPQSVPPPVPSHRQFRGYTCTQDCSGHQAGYEWARKKGVTERSQCGGRSRSFIEGCQAFADEWQRGN